MSLFDVSLETANSLYKWGWRGSIFGAVITALAVASLMWGTRVRDRDFEARMTELNVVAGQARERASAADERAAALEKQAAQLRLDLEKERAFREPRTLTQTQQNSVAAKIRAFAGTGFVMYVQLAPEPIDFLLQLEAILRTAKWLPHPPSPQIPKLNLPNLVPVGQSLSFFGIRVWFDATHNPSLKLAAEALSSALSVETISTTLDNDPFSDGADPSFIIIQIGEKPRASLQ